MSLQKKAIIWLSFLLALCIAATGCASTSKSGQSTIADLSDTSANTSEPSGLSENRDESAEPSLTDTTAPVEPKPPLATASSTKASSTIKPTTSAPAASTSPVKPTDIVLDSLLGQSGAYITQQFGGPVAIEKSEYGFNWYVYHNNYSRFFMIGIQNNKVVGLYSNSKALKFGNVTVGTVKSSVRAAMKGYAGPLDKYEKGNTYYKFQPEIMAQRDIFTDGQKYVTVFYDNIKGGVLAAVQIIDYSTEQSVGGLPAPNTELAKSYERISFYLINSIRVIFNKSILQYDLNMAGIAAAHSQDMINRHYFDHPNPEGLRVADRIIAAGYSYRRCAENIAQNHPSAISAHENYMNSSGHRENILGDYKNVGVGVRMAEKSILQTQVYITYP